MSYTNYARVPGEAPARRTLPPLAVGPRPASPEAARAAVARVEVPAPPEARIVKGTWSKTTALVGEQVTLLCELEGPPPPKLRLAIFEHDQDEQHDFVRALEGTPKGARCEVTWTVEAVEDLDDVGSEQELAEKGYTLPEYFFVATDRRSSKDSGHGKGQLLEVTDIIDQVFHDPWTGAPLEGQRYVLTLADGRRIEGALDQEGRVRVERVPPAPFWFRVQSGEVDPFEAEPAVVVGEDGDEGLAPSGEGGVEPSAPEPRAVIDAYAEPAEAVEGDEVVLAARVRGFAAGARAVFRLYKLGKGLDPDAAIAEVEGAVEGERASARWTIAAEAATGSGESEGRAYADLDLEVEVDGVRFRTLDTPELRAWAKPAAQVEEDPPLRLVLDLDPSLEETSDDTVTLTGDDGYARTLSVKQDGRPCGRMTDLSFEGTKPGARYSCKVDPGKEGAPYFVFRDRLHARPREAAR